MTAALGVRVVVIEGLSDPTGAHGAPPRAIGLRALCGQELQMCGNSSYDHKFTHRYRYRCLFTEMFPERRPRINSQFTPQMDVPVCSTGTCERHHERRPRPRGSSTRSRVRQTGARRS